MPARMRASGTCETRNRCMSPEIVWHAARALRPGGLFIFCCHHGDHWKETRRGSRWAFYEDTMTDLLEENIALAPERGRGRRRSDPDLLAQSADAPTDEAAHARGDARLQRQPGRERDRPRGDPRELSDKPRRAG